MADEIEYYSPVPAGIAISEINEFRKAHPGIGHAVWYDPESILKYLEEEFPKLKARLSPKDPYKVVVGHYFKIHKGRISFFVIPTLYNTETKEVIDRISGRTYVSVLSEYLTPNPEAETKAMQNNIGDDEAFDKGDMWP